LTEPTEHIRALEAQLERAQDSGGATACLRGALADAAADESMRRLVEFLKKAVTFRPLAA
jgi:hypothetical protein